MFGRLACSLPARFPRFAPWLASLRFPRSSLALAHAPRFVSLAQLAHPEKMRQKKRQGEDRTGLSDTIHENLKKSLPRRLDGLGWAEAGAKPRAYTRARVRFDLEATSSKGKGGKGKGRGKEREGKGGDY